MNRPQATIEANNELEQYEMYSVEPLCAHDGDGARQHIATIYDHEEAREILRLWNSLENLNRSEKMNDTHENLNASDGINELVEENRHIKDMLANLSKTHAKHMQRLSDMIDFRENAIRKMRDAKGRYHTELATRALFDILPENVEVRHERDEARETVESLTTTAFDFLAAWKEARSES